MTPHLIIQRVFTPLQWLRIRMLYRQSFPVCERKPFSIITAMHRKGKTDVWYCSCNGRFAGFATTINDADLILIDYLAVPKNQRGHGFGTEILAALKKAYDGKGLFVEIESIWEDVPDQPERIRRKHFYESCGFRPLGVLARVFDVPMELLGWHCQMNFAQYQAFYRSNYSAMAARNLVEEAYPETAVSD